MKIQARVNELIEEAVDVKASDIFVFPRIDSYQISLRLGEKVQFLQELELTQGTELLNYFKFVAQMDISEHRRPQVGAWIKEVKQQKVFLRLSCVGNFNDQESLVIRLIYNSQENNYFFRKQLKQLVSLSQKRGMVITSGPTGSGKTSTMYEVARLISQNKMVMTIEDPIEIWEPRFLQTQVNLTAGVEYLDLLKAALRHRPDVLIIGEIRDAQTAQVAINAALSGHLVLATVHAKSTFQTLSRLEGLGIRRDELYNAITGVSYQRLIPDSNQQLSCLLDIASGQQLKEQIFSQQRADFVSWSVNLRQLKEKGKITHDIFEKYQIG